MQERILERERKVEEIRESMDLCKVSPECSECGTTCLPASTELCCNSALQEERESESKDSKKTGLHAQIH